LITAVANSALIAIIQPGIARRPRRAGRTLLTSWRGWVAVEDRGTTWSS
jgi:hypothetical protein